MKNNDFNLIFLSTLLILSQWVPEMIDWFAELAGFPELADWWPELLDAWPDIVQSLPYLLLLLIVVSIYDDNK